MWGEGWLPVNNYFTIATCWRLHNTEETWLAPVAVLTRETVNGWALPCSDAIKPSNSITVELQVKRSLEPKQKTSPRHDNSRHVFGQAAVTTFVCRILGTFLQQLPNDRLVFCFYSVIKNNPDYNWPSCWQSKYVKSQTTAKQVLFIFFSFSEMCYLQLGPRFNAQGMKGKVTGGLACVYYEITDRVGFNTMQSRSIIVLPTCKEK